MVMTSTGHSWMRCKKGKLPRIRGLEQLIAPRIYVRNLGGTFTIFYCHDRAMLEEFARLSEALKRHEYRP